MSIQDTTVINRPIEALFDCVTSEKLIHRLISPTPTPQFFQVSEGAMGVGAKFHLKVEAGGSSTMLPVEIIAYQRPTSFAFKMTRGVNVTTYRWSLRATPTGTKVTLRLRTRRETALGRVLSPLLFLISARDRRDEQTFRQYLEDQCEH